MGDPKFSNVVTLSDESIDRLATAIGEKVGDAIGSVEVHLGDIGAAAYLDLIAIVKRALDEREGGE